MTSRDHLRAAARCWEHTGFYEDAAERFTTAEAWRDAGRCFSQAERHADAAVAYSRADEPLLEAREHLMGSHPSQGRSLYKRLRPRPFVFPSSQVEVLLGLGDIAEATRTAITSNDREAATTFARLASTRGRPDLAVGFWPQMVEPCRESLTSWNRSLRWQLSPPVAESAKAWPSVEFSGVSLVPIWEENTGEGFWGARALDWSADSTCFAAALANRGLARGRVGPDGVRLERWQLPGHANCIRFLPASHAFLAGLERGGAVSLVLEDGSLEPVENLRMPNAVWSITFAPEGDRVAVAAAGINAGALLRVWSWQKGHAQAQVEELREPEGHCWPLTAWSPDGRLLCWSPGPALQPNRLLLAGQPTFEAHTKPISSLTFTADARFLISASRDQTLVVRDGGNGQPLAPPQTFADPINGATVHPLAALVAVGEGNRAHLLRFHSGEAPQLSRLSVQRLDEKVFSLAFSPDGHHLLVMTWDHLHLFLVDLKP